MAADSSRANVVRGVLRACAAGAVFALVLVGTAGTAGWWQAWAFVAASTVAVAALHVLVFDANPDLVRERATAGALAPAWDRHLVRGMNLSLPLMLALAGLDHRSGWTPAWGMAPSLAALVCLVVGNAITLQAMRANAFFSSHVRIQRDRNHVPVGNGPYACVRHPGYAGAVLYNLAAAVLLGSVPALVVAGVFVVLVVIRTALEDATLTRELPGYAEYARRVRSRLVPLLW
ncbi:MAG: isoprenylcysteine carboxylmethyltransferase family protein [Myxococcota bacterium]